MPRPQDEDFWEGKEQPEESDERDYSFDLAFNDDADPELNDYDMPQDSLDDDSDSHLDDEFEFERRERLAKMAAEAQRDRQKKEEEYPGLSRFGERAEKVIGDYDEFIRHSQGDVFERTLASVPEEIGNNILSRVERYTANAKRERDEKYYEDKDEDIISDLEWKVSGILDLARISALQDEDLFVKVVRATEGANQATSIYESVSKAAPQIASAKDDPRISQHLHALSLLTSADKSIDSEETFTQLTTVPYLTDLALATRGKVPALPEEISSLLVDEETRPGYVKMLSELPAARHLSPERFVAYAGDFDKQRFFANWIGKSASPERIRILDEMREQYGHEGLVRLGKPLLTALVKKAKGDPELMQELISEGIPTIYAAIPSSNQSPPAWIPRLRKKLEKVESGQVLETIRADIGERAARNQIEEAVDPLKRKYQSLGKQMVRTNAVRNGPLAWEDYLLQLDEDIIEAMDNFDGKKAKIVTAMGHDLEAVNATYRDSGLPADMVVGLYNSRLDSEGIKELAGRVSESQKQVLRRLQSAGSQDIVFDLARNHKDLETRLADFEGFDQRDTEIYAIARQAGVRDSIAYVNSLDIKQKEVIDTTAQGKRATLIKMVKPENLPAYDLYRQTINIGEDSIENRFLGGMVIGDKKRVNQTLKAYVALSDEDREFLKTNDRHFSESWGTVLREFGTVRDPDYDLLNEEWQRIHVHKGNGFPTDSRLEGKLKPFCSMYAGLGEDQRLDVVRSMGEAFNYGIEKAQLLELAVKNVPNNPSYFTAAVSLMGQGLAKEAALAIARDPRLQEAYQQVDRPYIRTWVEFAQAVDDTDRFYHMPPADFHIAAQAYEFAQQNNVTDAFFEGFNESLGQGTVSNWSKAIIDHFREDAKGGANYRTLVGEGAA